MSCQRFVVLPHFPLVGVGTSQAQRILDQLALSRPDSEAFEKLAQRVQQCKAAAAIVNSTDLAGMDVSVLRAHLLELEPFWAEMPMELTVRVSSAVHRGLMNDMADMEDASGAEGVDLAEKIVVSLFPCRDSGLWSGATCKFAPILEHAFSSVESLVEEIAGGFAGGNASQELEEAAEDSKFLIQAWWNTLRSVA